MNFSVDFIYTEGEIAELVASLHGELRPLDIEEGKYRATFRSREKALAFTESFDGHHYGHLLQGGGIKEELPRTTQPKVIVEGDKAYDKCPFCDYRVFDPFYNPKSGLRVVALGPGKIYEHIKDVHSMIWMTIGGKGRWHHIQGFKPQEEK